MLGLIRIAIAAIPKVVKVAKKAVKLVKKVANKAKNKTKNNTKKKKKSNKKKKKKKKKSKIGKIFTKARKIANKLSKNQIVKKFKKTMKKAVLKTKKAVKKVKAVTKKAVKGIKKATKFITSGGFREGVSAALDFIPVVGNIKSGIEAITGVDPITGRKLETWERAVSAAGIVGGPLAKGAKHGGKAVSGIIKNSKRTNSKTKQPTTSSKPPIKSEQQNAGKINASEEAKKKKAKTLDENRRKGREFEKEKIKEFKKVADHVEEQITIKTHEGTKMRVDAIGIDKNTDKILIQEYKSSKTAPLTKNQKVGFEELSEGGGVVVGKGKGIFKGGTQIPPTKVEVVRSD